MEMQLRRRDLTRARTIGQLFLNGIFECYTLEDAVHPGPKIFGGTAIPEGRYRVLITESKRFGRPLPILCSVPGFEGIRIHPGNDAANTDGCILVGRERGIDEILGSRLAMKALQPKLETAIQMGEEIWISISTPQKGAPA